MGRDSAVAGSSEPYCPVCQGNDADMPCAYPGEDKPGCLLAARRLRERAIPVGARPADSWQYRCVMTDGSWSKWLPVAREDEVDVLRRAEDYEVRPLYADAVVDSTSRVAWLEQCHELVASLSAASYMEGAAGREWKASRRAKRAECGEALKAHLALVAAPQAVTKEWITRMAEFEASLGHPDNTVEAPVAAPRMTLEQMERHKDEKDRSAIQNMVDRMAARREAAAPVAAPRRITEVVESGARITTVAVPVDAPQNDDPLAGPFERALRKSSTLVAKGVPVAAPPDPLSLSEFRLDQWWYPELEQAVYRSRTDDGVRALAVVRRLVESIPAAIGAPSQEDENANRRRKEFVENSKIMQALREVAPVATPQEQKNCPYCDGAGYVMTQADGRQPCRHCGTTGKVRAAPVAAPEEPVVPVSTLERMFEDLNGMDPERWGYAWKKGWNDALRRAMDYAQPQAIERDMAAPIVVPHKPAPKPIENNRIIEILCQWYGGDIADSTAGKESMLQLCRLIEREARNAQ